MTGMDVIGQ